MSASASSSIFSPAIDLIPTIRNESGAILTVPFLSLCRLSIVVLERFGAAMAIVRGDIGGNIDRLQKAYDGSPAAFAELHQIVMADVAAGSMRGAYSNTNGLLWLSRAMDFLVQMLRNLQQNSSSSVFEAASAAYHSQLSQHHGWIARQAFTMALNLCPDRDSFFSKLGGGDISGDIDRFISAFTPLLEANFEFLRSVGADSIKAS